jgi:hypothetical protein
MEISLNDEQLKDAVVAAIVGTMTGEKRDALLQNAIKSLFEVRTDSYSREKKSRIQEAFDSATHQFSVALAKEFLTTEPYNTQIRGIFHDALTQVFESKREAVVEQLASTLGDALVKGMSRDY